MNKDVPAIIVSAGPSLDKNLAEMINYKDKLNYSPTKVGGFKV